MPRIFRFLLLITIFVWSAQSRATLYEPDFSRMGQSYLSSLGWLDTDQIDQLPNSQQEKCRKRYSQITSDGVIDIRIIIGYFDWTTGGVVSKDGTNYGLSPSVDPGAYKALKSIITGPCIRNSAFCRFSQQGPYLFTKSVNVQGRQVLAKIEMYYASVSEYLNANLGKYANEQKNRSAATLAQFNSALKNADVVFYLGHSRNGGGPDFNPPIFIPGTNKINYSGYYKAKRPGLKKLVTTLQNSSKQPAILGLMSCDSRDHFLSSVRRTAPKTGVISSTNVLLVDGVFTALIGASDAVLRGQCQPGFLKSIRRTTFNEKNITMDGVF